MKILILGHKGMLGHMVHKYLSRLNKYTIDTTSYRWPSNEFREFVKNYDGDYIINCIGAIHQKTSDFDVNWELPIFLDFYAKCKIVHPGTDCEIDKDNYGVSKKIAKDFIFSNAKQTKSLTTSIIGPELNGHYSLMNWFLSKEDGSEVFGFTKAMWNGNTTLTWAIQCVNLIENYNEFDIDTTLSSDCVSKKEILDIINEVYERKIIVKEKNTLNINKCLDGKVKTSHIKQQLIELKKFIQNFN